jgi:hypothetical protein
MRYLRRYTDVLSLLDILKNNRLTLLSPETWFDQNDTFGLREYSKRMGEGSAYALCMTEDAETGHHWQLFAGTSHGVCIQFDRDEFISFLDRFKRPILHGPMKYLNLKEVREMTPIETDALPFLKRETFKDENEYRIISWEVDFLAEATYSIPMPASLIKKVTLGPRMPRTLAETLKDIACALDGCHDIAFAISRVHNNESWRRAIIEGLSGNSRL